MLLFILEDVIHRFSLNGYNSYNLGQVTSQNSEGHNELLINNLVTLFSVRELYIQYSVKDTDLTIFGCWFHPFTGHEGPYGE